MHLAISGVAEFEWEYWWLSVVKTEEEQTERVGTPLCR